MIRVVHAFLKVSKVNFLNFFKICFQIQQIIVFSWIFISQKNKIADLFKMLKIRLYISEKTLVFFN
jgi:hypothetical protein